MVRQPLTRYITTHLTKTIFAFFVSLITLLLITLPNASWAKVDAFLNQSIAYTDDPITLTIETSGKTDGSANPDLSPLNKDFTVLGTSNHSQISIINGQTSAKKSWIIKLQPLRQGKITIPAITVGNKQTLPLTLTISDAPPEVAAKTKQHVFVEASVALKDDKPPYIQQQISYTVKLFYDEQLLDYEMYPPTIDNAVIEQLQQKEKYRATRNGKNYNVIERNYVISAEKSGKLTIPPTIVKGSIRTEQQHNQRQQRRQDPFFNDPFGSSIFSGSFFSQRGKAITLRTDSIEVAVQPLPMDFKGDNWLPAETIELKDSWQQQLPIFRVGEPVTRTLTIEAKGLASSQIPKLVFPPIDQIRTYPDKEDKQNYTDGTTVIGISTQTISYIPNKAGSLQLPEITLDWWNVVTKQQETARLPAITITIEAGSATTGTDNQQNPPTPQQDSNNATLTTEESSANLDESSKSSLLLTLTMLVGLIGIGFILVKHKTRLRNQYHHSIQKLLEWKHSTLSPNNEKQLRQHLQYACEKNNTQQAAHYLLQLAQQQWPDDQPQNLGMLADQLVIGTSTVRTLNHCLYAADDANWQGTKLWELVNTGLQKKQLKKVQVQDGLDVLYPMR